MHKTGMQCHYCSFYFFIKRKRILAAMWSASDYCVLFVIVLVLLILPIVSRLTLGISKSNTCLVGKTVLITGGNSGLGFQTALALAGRGARVIIANKSDANESIRRITDISGNRNLVYKHVDLSSLASVRKLAQEINQEEDRLDILINNAGGTYFGSEPTEDGLQPGIQVNHLGSFLLTHLLVDLLKKSAPSRIIFVSSALAFINDLTVENINVPPQKISKYFSELYVYGNSKLMNIITANMFGQKLRSNGVTAYAVHPGIVNTQIFAKYSLKGSPSLLKFFVYKIFLPLYGKSAWEGAQTQIECAISKELRTETGKFFADCRIHVQPWKAHNKEFCEKMWKRSEELVKLKESEKLA